MYNLYNWTFRSCSTLPRWDLAEVRCSTQTVLLLMRKSTSFSCEAAVISRIQRAVWRSWEKSRP